MTEPLSGIVIVLMNELELFFVFEFLRDYPPRSFMKPIALILRDSFEEYLNVTS